ncbi:MAG: response regulator [Campylobacterota bacterium]|nr:response regulator [Campylobacterota bacterium]
MSIQEEQNLFMASISHELRTPLTSILGYGELLEHTNLDSKQQEYLNRMLHSSKYLLSLVGDFLDIVKLEKNDIKLDQKEVRLHTILSECADIIKANIHKDVTFEVDIPFLNYTILADDRRIKQVMLNFLSNAVKFTQKGTIKFYLKEVVEIDEEIKITVNIEDTGTGMSTEIQKALFDPFVTGDSTQGFGLGLFISKEIIKLMDGEVHVTSKEGEGSIFSVSFVVKRSYNKEFSKTLSEKNILILADESEFVEKISNLLGDFNATIQHYSTSHNISNTLRDIVSNPRDYDMALFDMNSLSSPAADIISTLRLIYPSIKCVALLEKYSFTCTSCFDRLIHTPTNAKDVLFELEELSSMGSYQNSSMIDFSHLRVLVVEDVEMSRDFIREMLLISFSITCDIAANGQEAVEKSILTQYDIIFMDIRMPIMNGFEATKEIRKQDKRVPIVCMSADVYEKDIRAAKDSGMDSFIEKPLDKNEVKQSFLTLVDGGVKDIELSTLTIKSIPDREYSQSEKCDPMKLKREAYSYLEKNFDSDTTIELLGKATKSIEKYIDNIQSHMSIKNIEALIEDFHALKGVLANLGLKKQATAAGEIQEIYESGDAEEIDSIEFDFITNMLCFVNELKSTKENQ